MWINFWKQGTKRDFPRAVNKFYPSKRLENRENPRCFSTLSTSYAHFVDKMWIACWKEVDGAGIRITKKKLDESRLFPYNWCDILILGLWVRLALYHIAKGGTTRWKWHFSPRPDREQRFMVSEREWALPTAEKFWLPEEQREESSYPPKAAANVAFCLLHRSLAAGRALCFYAYLECGKTEWSRKCIWRRTVTFRRFTVAGAPLPTSCW